MHRRALLLAGVDLALRDAPRPHVSPRPERPARMHEQHLQLAARLRRMEGWEDRAQDLLERFELGEAAHRVTSGFSHGMGRRLSVILACFHEPTVLKGGDFTKIESLARQTYSTLSGEERPLLSPSEVTSLSVTRGSLTPTEIDEIRSHVTHTYNFLSTIPWGKSFRRIPIIAGAHHEKLNGTGYPHKLSAADIPIQARMMTIADIFDALSASDRPYKKAVPVERALDILRTAVQDGELDPDLFALFVEARVYDRWLVEPTAY